MLVTPEGGEYVVGLMVSIPVPATTIPVLKSGGRYGMAREPTEQVYLIFALIV